MSFEVITSLGTSLYLKRAALHLCERAQEQIHTIMQKIPRCKPYTRSRARAMGTRACIAFALTISDSTVPRLIQAL